MLGVLQPDLMTSIDMALRGAAAVLFVLVAGLLLRDYRKTPAGRLGSFFAVGAAAHTLSTALALRAASGPAPMVLTALASGNSLVFWLFARTLFDDRARPSLGYVLPWALIAGSGVACRYVLAASHPLRPWLAMQAVLFAIMAGAQSVTSFGSDLIEPRRRLRIFIVVAAGAYTVVTSLAALLGTRNPTPAGSVAEAAVLLLLALIVTVSLLRVDGEGLFIAARDNSAAPEPLADHSLNETERAQLDGLMRAMRMEHLYRREGLTVAELAAQQKIPAYKLRRLINRGLGFRNFPAFLNHYRLADVKARLRDPSHASTPILTIALDAGFSSLGPFNRAFKAEIGLTPGEYRRAQQQVPSSATRSTR